MKLYYHPLSTVCRPIMQFCEDTRTPYEPVLVDLMTGAHREPAYLAINPAGLVPALVDGEFTLTESSAILKYLAERTGSPAYPQELRARARVNERMDWFNTTLYRELGYHLCYPQLFPHHRREPQMANDITVEWGKKHALRACAMLNDHWLANAEYVCGDHITIADYFGAAIVTVTDHIGVHFDAFPHVQRWLATVKAMPSWRKANAVHDGFAASLRGKQFVTLA